MSPVSSSCDIIIFKSIIKLEETSFLVGWGPGLKPTPAEHANEPFKAQLCELMFKGAKVDVKM